MTQEQIKQANKYAKEHGEDVIEDDKLEDAFLAGAESRQPEIDALTAEVKQWKQDAAESQERERIARKLHDERKQEATDLRQQLRSGARWIPVPRDRDGLVKRDAFRLPPAEAYLCRTDNEDPIPYETAYEFTHEGDLKGVVAVLPIPAYREEDTP